MKKRLLIIAAGFLLLFGSGYFVVESMRRSVDLAAKGEVYANTVIPVIIALGTPAFLMASASPEFLKSTSREQMEALCKEFRKLGALRQYQKVKMASFVESMGSPTKAVFYSLATFDSGDAEIEVALMYCDNAWKLNGFHVKPAVKPTKLRP